jgi:hypothetical protein
MMTGRDIAENFFIEAANIGRFNYQPLPLFLIIL